MDDNRVVTGLAAGQRLPDQVRQTEESRNDLDGESGAEYQPPPRRRPSEPTPSGQSALEPRPPITDDPPSGLIQDLDRLRNLDEHAEAEITHVRRARGIHHYREVDPETSKFYRFRDRRDEPAAPDEAAGED